MQRHRLFTILLLLWALLAFGLLPVQAQGSPAPPPSGSQLFLPLIGHKSHTDTTCVPIPGASFESLPVPPPSSDRPAAQHADLNLSLRGYTSTDAARTLVWIDGATDVMAPQLFTLFGDQRMPQFNAVYQVYDWDWDCNCRGEPLASPKVTLAALQTTPGEVLFTPASGYDLGSGYKALVLYADPHQLTLKYTRDDNVVLGYTIHLSGLCVDPGLVATYRHLDADGRSQLPALTASQAVGSASSDSVLVAIRDSGRFMDPRSQKDWWRFHRWLF